MVNKRLLSLDAFRGFTIAAMILVNFPGSWSHVYPPLLHADWNGLTPTDLIFPFFLFIVGMSIVLSLSDRRESGQSSADLYKKILWRSLKIFAVGILLNFIHHFNIHEIRYVGVLQRIAVVYLLTSIIFLHLRWRMQIGLLVFILISYWVLMKGIPTPGYDRAMLEPGINLAAWMDAKFLPGKLWQGTWDPEGLLSTLPALGTGIMGLLTGELLKSKESPADKLLWMFTMGCIAMVAGYLVSLSFPVNKNLWTSSFVLVTGGMAMTVFAASIFLVDMKHRKRFILPGLVLGANAITVYVLADLLAMIFYSMEFAGSSLNTHFISLGERFEISLRLMSFIYAFLFLLLNYLPALWLYRRKIFIRL